jgi:hypothetical protein
MAQWSFEEQSGHVALEIASVPDIFYTKACGTACRRLDRHAPIENVSFPVRRLVLIDSHNVIHDPIEPVYLVRLRVSNNNTDFCHSRHSVSDLLVVLIDQKITITVHLLRLAPAGYLAAPDNVP